MFSDASGGTGIVQDLDSWLNTDDTSYPIASKTRDINSWLDRVVALILSADGRWQFDDSNYTDFPCSTTTLVDSQQNYTLSGATFLDVTRLEVMDQNGNYNLLEPIDEHDVNNQALSEFYKTPGRPLKYDKRGDSIFLYPKPGAGFVTMANGLKVLFQRGPSHFVVGDTTKVPGFNPLFHRILSLGPALDYASKNELTTKIKIIQPRLDKLEAGLLEAYAVRSKDEKVRMTVGRENYGADLGYHGSDKAIS